MDDGSNQIRAFFPDRASADAAADELRASGVDNGDIAVQGSEGGGFLDGVKRFFSGEELDGSNGDGALLVVQRADRETLEPVLARYGGRMGATETNGGTMKLHEERLNVTKHAEKEGEVRLTKDVETRQEEIDVPVKREEVLLTRRRVDEPEDRAELGEGEEVRIPVLRDEVQVEKEVVTTEEVGVEKRPVEETQHVSASLRKERARLETDGHVGATLNDE